MSSAATAVSEIITKTIM